MIDKIIVEFDSLGYSKIEGFLSKSEIKKAKKIS